MLQDYRSISCESATHNLTPSPYHVWGICTAEWRSISLVANTTYDTTGRAGIVPGSEWRRLKLRYCKSMLTNDLKDFKRLVRTTIGLGRRSEARDPDFRIVTSMNSHYALSANLLNSLDPKKVYMVIAAGPLNKPRHSSLMQVRWFDFYRYILMRILLTI